LRKRSQKTRTLAYRISLATFLVVSGTVLAASLLALAGVYNLVWQETTVRIEGYRDLLHHRIDSRLNVVDEFMDTIVEGAALDVATPKEAISILDRMVASNAEYFELVALTSESGDVIAFSSVEEVAIDLPEGLFEELQAGETVREWIPSDPLGSIGHIWFARSFAVSDGTEPRVLVASARTEYIHALLDEVSDKDTPRVALISDSDGNVIYAGESDPDLLTGPIYFEEDEDVAGIGLAEVVEDDTFGPMTGFYADLLDTSGLEWRVVVFEPTNVVMARTRAALLPASFTVLLAVLVATQFAWFFARRLLEPLREFEARAEDAASGAYIQPIVIERQDEVGRLAAGFNAMALRLNSLLDLSQLLASASELDQVLDGILSAMEHILQTGQTAVFLLDKKSEFLVLARVSGTKDSRSEVKISLSDPSWVSQAFRSGMPVSFITHSDPGYCDPALETFGDTSMSSGLAVPLMIGRLPIGVALALTTEFRTFTEGEMEMARTFSAQAAVAVQNSRLFEEEHTSRTEAEALREMAELLASPSGLEETFTSVGQIVAELLEVSGSAVAMRPKQREALLMEASKDPGLDEAYLEVWEQQRELDPEAPLSLPMVVVDSPEGRSDSVLPKSMILIPMLLTERPVGVLVLECVSGRRMGSRELEVCQAVGKTISVALENASLFQQARRRAENLETVFRISQAVSLSLQTSVVLNRVLDVVQKILTADAVALMRYDEGKRIIETAMARGVRDRRLLHAEVESGEDIPGNVFASKEPVRLGEIERVSTPMSRLLVEMGFQSWLCVPLLARGRSIGVLSAFSTEPRAFSAEDVELMGTFASQGALALDTAELFGKEHRVASVLQKSILPDVLPDISWLQMSSVYQPAGSESEIGGDYYDVFDGPDGRLVLAIGDVCGKGVEAATKTSMIKYALRGLVTAGLEPAVVMEDLSTMVAETGDVADIVTLWVGYIDPEGQVLTYASGGHPPVLVRSSAGSVIPLPPTGPILGAVADAEYTQDSIDLPVGSHVLLYTDGVTEARRKGGLFGEERVKKSLAKGGSVDEVLRRLLDEVTEFSRGPLRDDVAILSVKVTGDGGVGS